MPKRRAVWSSWNHIGRQTIAEAQDCPTVTYWMNSLQNIPHDTPLFVTLNPQRHAAATNTTARSTTIRCSIRRRFRRSGELWSLQGRRNTWFCGSYFGAGFHEDGLQAGLAVAEALGGVRRPWNVANESGRISLDPPCRRRRRHRDAELAA